MFVIFYFLDEEALYFENFDLENIFTPVRADVLQKFLEETNYDTEKTQFLVNGFKDGFDLGYQGAENVQQKSPNLKLTIGNKTELWNKVMKEVKEKRYAGPFDVIPFENFIQSPIGLVPKDNGKKTRLIFHLSYPRNTDKSVNINTPKELTSVKYKDLDEAIRLCLKHGKTCMIGKSDLISAFRHICMNKKSWKYLVMKAQSPIDNKEYYFVDKCMPFGAAISCAIFQEFSNALAHIVKSKTKHDNINYLDDFFFAAICKWMCDYQITTFLEVCKEINFPVSMEKTFWGRALLIFLGILIDTKRQLVLVPHEKVVRARQMILKMLESKKKKTTLRELQQLCGFLNFIGKCIVPGRAFTRRLYNFGCGIKKPHHHIMIKQEMRMDLQMWKNFLEHPSVFSRPFFQFDNSIDSLQLNLYTDAAKAKGLGCGGYHNNEWFVAQWDENFLEEYNPSINYLELYAVTVAVLLWIEKFRDRKVTLFCDNMSVVHMINNNASKCKNCMVLIRIIVLHGLIHNVKITARHIEGKLNIYADLISRMKYSEFRKISRQNKIRFDGKPKEIPLQVWPVEKIYLPEDD